jgi:hypothetical protein
MFKTIERKMDKLAEEDPSTCGVLMMVAFFVILIVLNAIF